MPDDRGSFSFRADQSGSEEPPPEAYSRVTNPERFAPLHEFAAELLARLEREFEVERVEGYDLDAYLGTEKDLVRPVVTIEPREPDAAPIRIGFSKFPGLSVRFGRWVTMSFPACGCDACNERVEDEIEHLQFLGDDIVTGRFRESVRIPAIGDAWREYGFESRESGSMRLERDEAQQMVAGGLASYEWKAWPRRL